MRFLNITLCFFLLMFQFPYSFIRWLAFKVSTRTNWTFFLLWPLVVVGFVFYMCGGVLVYLARSKTIHEQELLLSQLELFRLDNSTRQYEKIRKLFQLEELPFERFNKEQRELGIFVKAEWQQPEQD